MTRNEFIAQYMISLANPQGGAVDAADVCIAEEAADNMEKAGVAPWPNCGQGHDWIGSGSNRHCTKCLKHETVLTVEEL